MNVIKNINSRGLLLLGPLRLLTVIIFTNIFFYISLLA